MTNQPKRLPPGKPSHMLRVRLPRHLWHLLLDAASQSGISVSQLVREGIEDRTALLVRSHITGQNIDKGAARDT